MNFPSTQPLRSGLSPAEVASALGVTTRTLRNWRKVDFGPVPISDRGRLLYDRAAVEAFARGAR